MQSESTELSQNASVRSTTPVTTSSTQHGLFGDPTELPSSPLSPSGQRSGSIETSSTEWSLSPTSELASPSSSGLAGLSSRGREDGHVVDDLDLESLSLALAPNACKVWHDDRYGRLVGDEEPSRLPRFPQELLFHVMSHLPAQDLLTVKLVSRHFYSLVTSPTAWSNAFSKYFPGPELLRSSQEGTYKSEVRVFTRLSASSSWSSEYLARTRLLRALMKGQPSLPFAAPCPGKPGKGSATFTFSSRIWHGCTALDADFGSIFDKRKPQFIHGSAASGAVLSSDRRGKFDAWGYSNPVFFRHFHEIHPGVAPYGMGAGTCVGVPNMMELSQQHGMLYGEGLPNGNLYFLGIGEKQSRLLTSFTGVTNRTEGIPRLSNDLQCPTALWITKSSSMPRVSQGVIGMLVGSSNGTLSAYSLGSQGGQRYERGEMTARWALSPGVPIIAVYADNHFTENRYSGGRIWGFALNALGELFYMQQIPQPVEKIPALRSATPEEAAEKEEFRAWQTGVQHPWKIVAKKARQSRYEDENAAVRPPGLSNYDDEDSDAATIADRTLSLQPWFSKTPAEIRSEFTGWDMQQRLLVDFANDDGRGGGETAVVISHGGGLRSSTITRFKRSKSPFLKQEHNTSLDVANDAEAMQAGTELSTLSDTYKQDITTGSSGFGISADKWFQSIFSPGVYNVLHVTATAADESTHATTTLAEDDRLQKARTSAKHGRAPRADDQQIAKSANAPGRRGRLFAAGTATGFVFVWDIRAPTSKELDLINDVQPVRVIATDSPGIASIALSSLYLVHGGTEGLLQAWDLLASTTEPLRTLSSRRFINNRRRAILAAQQASVPATWATQNTERLAASTICLDPDPQVLKGVATIDSWIKYWSFSSASSAEEMSRSQKRKLKRGNGSKNANLTGGEAEMGTFASSGGQRRTNLKIYANHELQHHKQDEVEQRRAEKEDRRFAGRFGTRVLGEDASEEEMLAYAMLLSQEETENKARRAVEATMKLRHDASADEVEAHKAALSERDAKNWKFMTWPQRYQLQLEDGVALPSGMLDGPTKSTPTAEDADVRKATNLSLEDQREWEQSNSSGSPTPPSAGPSNEHNVDLENDPELAEAIALSMTTSQKASSSPPAPEPSGRAALHSPHVHHEEDDISRAIRLSLADQSPSSPATERRASHASDAEFPSLPSSSPPEGSVSGGGRRGKGKGRKSGW